MPELKSAISPGRAAPDAAGATPLPPLVEGQRLDQPTFHARYEAMPPEVRAELIDGVVYMPSPVSRGHSSPHVGVLHWLLCYEERTPGVELHIDATVILDDRNERQPDALLRIRPECGGQSRDEGRYIGGAPELVGEVAKATRYVDLGPKLVSFERLGVFEYIVRAADPDEVLWHVRDEATGRFTLLAPDADGLLRSRAFAGLWLDPAALLAGDRAAVRAAVDRGLATPEHAAFVAALAAARGTP